MTAPAWPATRFKLDVGDRMPNIFGPDQHGGRFSIFQAPPGPFAVLSVPAGGEPAADAAIATFDRVAQAAQGLHLNAVVAMVGSMDEVHDKARSLQIRSSALADSRAELAQLFRMERDGGPDTSQTRAGVIAILMDPDQTVRTVIPYRDTDSFAAALTQALDDLERIGARADRAAPVLHIPKLLSPDQCRALMAIWKLSNQRGMVGVTGAYGESVDKASEHRVAHDHPVRDTALQSQILSTIGPRIRDAVESAFHFEVQCYEPFNIVCYPASEGGFFGSHRDNTNPARMHRRFALTLNLNTDEYEGGGVWFPEYSDRVYDPPAGDGIVFSCSLLHEARVVTRGMRFILCGFMWGAAEEALRQRNAREAAARRERNLPIAG